MPLKAYELGRKLIIDLGDEGDEDFIRVTIKPIASAKGAALQALHAGIAFGQSTDLERDAEFLGLLAVGEENWDLINGDLRWKESEAIINAGFFWNVQGGGIELVNILLNESLGGHPKALSMLMRQNGLSQAFDQLTTLLSSDAADETPEPDDTSATSTPPGSKT
jgi:hypothetical protein